jgi:uncharacterized surface protein with fasciclin (FAS1) repeats
MTLTPSITGLMITVLVLVVGSVGIAAEPSSKLVADFSDAAAAKKWVSVNDNVMGGVSKGGFRITDDKTLEFSGKISLENQGGFASIRTRPADLGLDGYDTISLRIKGDGRTYYLDLRTSGLFAAASYRAALKTQKDTWQEVRIPLNNFEYAAFGRRIATAGLLRASKVQSLGFTLADKRAGPFRLEVAWIKGEKSPAADGTQAATPSDGSAEPKDIVDTAVAAGQFKTLVAAVKAAGLVEALKGKGPLTVFAPNDDAFAKLPKGTVEELLKPENRDRLAAVLTYHVVPGKILLGAQSPATLEGQPLAIKTSGTFEVNQAKVIATDIAASNGVIHVIDAVLIPSAKKLPASQAASAVIELAIERGVPLFNAGQPAACAAVYEVAIESLLKSHTDALGGKDRSALQAALSKMRREKDPRQKAWTLRRALDAAYGSLVGN